MDVLKTTGMDKKHNELPIALSGGEQQRVAVARAVVGEPSIILADEPTASLDPKSAQAILDFLMEYHEKGTTVLVATHNLQKLDVKIEEGKPAQFRTNLRLSFKYKDE